MAGDAFQKFGDSMSRAITKIGKYSTFNRGIAQPTSDFI